MFLKRLEIRGFKSFADKTELEFPQGITAVVGPNGSGKSNISDAVRWVLGEQSAKSLRGHKMEDVIFAGSDSRKAVNYAEVTLVLDNDCQTIPIDYTEVAITRKVYRSGESDYLINNHSCRLKDITELFMDTGLGKEAYSIIGQGRIEEVLSTKSEERRGIFEEAAGIIKYKSRKREAEKRLDETEANLVRVHDVMIELEDQIGPLKEASDKAETYLTYRSDLTYLDISLLAYQIEQIDSQWKVLSKEKNILEEELAKGSSLLQSKEASYTELKWNLTKCEQQIDSLQQQFTELSTKLEKALGDKKVLIERKQNNRSGIDKMLMESNDLQKVSIEKMQTFKTKEDNYKQLKAQFESKQTELMREIHQLENYEAILTSQDEQTEALKGEIIDLLHQQTTVKNELRHIEQANENTTKKLNELTTQKLGITENRADLKKQKNDADEKIARNQQDYSHRQQQLKSQKDRIQSEHATLKQFAKEVQQKSQLIESKIGRKKILADLEAEYAGYYQGTKEILLAKRNQPTQFRGVKGALVDLIKAPKQYEIAIETSLGSALQNIVVEDEENAQTCIQFLKIQGRGRATFLPLSIIKGQTKRYSKSEQVDGFVGYAHELLTVDDEYKDIINRLLGNVMIATDITTATAIAKLADYRCRVVTLDGDFINPGGSMTGGSQQKRSSSLMSRKNEIDSLEHEIKETTIQLQNKEQEYNKQKEELDQHHEQASILQAKIEEIASEAIKLASQLQKIEQDLSYRDENIQMMEQELEHYHEELGKGKNRFVEQRNQLMELQEEQKTLEIRLTNYQQQLQEQTVQKNSTNEKVTDYKIELTKYQEQLKTLEEVRLRDTTEIQDIENRLQKIRDDVQEKSQQQELIESALLEFEASIKIENEQKLEMQQRIDRERMSRRRMQDQAQEQETIVMQYMQQTKAVEKQIHQIDVKINRFDVELNNALNQLQEEYEISFERAIEEYPLTEEPNDIKVKVKELKRLIAALGDVNTGAIEEYQRVNERYYFLKYQREDLLEATNKLNQVIYEMNIEMEKRFMESFNLIKDSFSKVFQQMFGGGRARLQLTDPSNVLTTGIEIFAEPPGKKLQHLSLLSGGERALTAIALLFAILRVSPVPFCILDEVEAALDETNVSRFANYLRKFSDQTQFIVVTHRKGTMECADVLYGVTMEGSGVSKMVSVKLEDVVNLDLGIDKIEAS